MIALCWSKQSDELPILAEHDRSLIMADSDYTLLQQRFDEKKLPLLGIHRDADSSSTSAWKYATFALGLSLLASAAINVVLIARYSPDETPSQFAHLLYNKPTAIVPYSDFSSTNRTVQDAAWNQPDMLAENGFVAFDESYVIEQGLPHSQRWPWDPSKGSYILTSAHDMHCLHTLREYINENNEAVPVENQTWPYAHIMHCLDVLRESTVCRADDTPMYTGYLHDNVFHKVAKAGRGQVKMCRDWHALQEWSRSHSACYRAIHFGDYSFDDRERYKFCPDGSKPWEAMPSLEPVDPRYKAEE